MARVAAKKKKSTPARLEIFFFPKNKRGVPLKEAQQRRHTQTISVTATFAEVDEPENPTQPFYVPDFFAKMKDDTNVKKAPTKLSPKEVQMRARLGRALFGEGKLKEAKAQFEAVVASGATHPYSHRMLGVISMSMGQVEKGLALFDATLRYKRKDVVARVYRAEILLGRGEVKRARHDLAYAVKVGPAQNPFVRRAAQLLARISPAVESRTAL